MTDLGMPRYGMYCCVAWGSATCGAGGGCGRRRRLVCGHAWGLVLGWECSCGDMGGELPSDLG